MEIEEQDWLASNMAELCVNVVACRLQRSMFLLRRWSSRSAYWLEAPPPTVLQAELARFKAEREDYGRIKHSTSGALRRPAIESQFRLGHVQQLDEALAETNYEYLSGDLIRFLELKHRRLLGSQIVEDSFQRQKRLKQTHYTRRLKVAAAFEVLVDKGVAHQIHKYLPPPPQSATPTRSSWLDPSTFEAPLAGSCKFDDVTSHKAAADWYSPSAERHGNTFVSGVLLAFARRWNCMGKLSDCWLATFLRASHSLLVRQAFPDGTLGPPCFALSFMQGSVGLVWPAVQRQCPGAANKFFWEFAPQASIDDGLAVVIDLNHWQAIQVVWRSLVWQFENLPMSRSRLPHHIRAYAKTSQQWTSLLAVAAQSGFWCVSLENLKSIAKYIGLGFSRDVDLRDDMGLVPPHLGLQRRSSPRHLQASGVHDGRKQCIVPRRPRRDG